MGKIELRVMAEEEYHAWRKSKEIVVSSPAESSQARSAAFLDIEELSNSQVLPRFLSYSFDDSVSLKQAERSILKALRPFLPPGRSLLAWAFVAARLLAFSILPGTLVLFLYAAFKNTDIRHLFGSPYLTLLFWCASGTIILVVLELIYWMKTSEHTFFWAYTYRFFFPFTPGSTLMLGSLDRRQPLGQLFAGPSEIMVLYHDPGSPGAEAIFWKGLIRNPPELKRFFNSVVDGVVDSRFDPPLLGGLVLYTEEDSSLAFYVRQYYAALHSMSGLHVDFYFLENTPKGNSESATQVAGFWTSKLAPRIYEVWRQLGLVSSRPYPNAVVYDLAQQIGVLPATLPCLVLFKSWKSIKTQRLVLRVTEPLPQFFRRVCTDVKISVEQALSGDPKRKVSFDEIVKGFKTVPSEVPPPARSDAGETPERGKTPSVFLCHSSIDKPFVERLASDLRQLGLGVWLDKWEIKVGDSIIERIQSGLGGNDYLIVVLSPSAVASPWVARELNAACIRELEERRVVILPVLYEQCAIPLLIRDKLYADFTTGYSEGLEKLSRRFVT